MKLQNTLLGAALLAAIGFSQQASAVTIDGITFQPGAVFETIDIFQGRRDGGAITAVGDELVGIGIVNRILAPDNTVLWANGDGGRELTIHYHSFIAESFATVLAGTTAVDTILFTGGVIEVRSDSTPDFTGAGTQAAGIASATDGALWLALAGSPLGGFALDGTTPITLESAAVRNATATPFEAGNFTGRGFLDVTGGNAAAYFDSNTFGCTGVAPCPDDADKVFTSSGQLNNATPDWFSRGTGEIQDVAVAIPEPATLALLAAGLGMLGFAKRRKQA
ncbi:MAG: PEP-CTERM sorting domain-containing protein [Nitrosomonas sp.]|nr:PEP-CTERM sorting domain-containing protein [Nitrosomonas sp.]